MRSQTLAEVQSLVGRETPREHQKLLAAVAYDHVLGSNLGQKLRREHAQHDVPALVTMCVIDALEVVDVHHHQAQGAPVPDSVSEFFGQPRVEIAAIAHPRQYVTVDRFMDALLYRSLQGVERAEF